MKPLAVLVGDLHLTDRTPVCRTDDYMHAQSVKLEFIDDLADKLKIPILCAGDVFDHWKASPALMSFAINRLPKFMYVVAGNHDLPANNIDLIKKSALYTLACASCVSIVESETSSALTRLGFNLRGLSWKQGVGGKDKAKELRKERNVLLAHVPTWHMNKAYKGQQADSATKLLRKHSAFDLIVTGDNHQSFSAEYNNRLLVNPGAVMRSAANQIEFQPRVAVWHADDKRQHIDWIKLPIGKDVITRDHIKIGNEKDERIEAFIKELKTTNGSHLSFVDNLNRFFKDNKIRKSVSETVWRAIDNGVDED